MGASTSEEPIYLDDLFEEICASTGLDKLAVHDQYVRMAEGMGAEEIAALGLPAPKSMGLDVWETVTPEVAAVIRQRLTQAL